MLIGVHMPDSRGAFEGSETIAILKPQRTSLSLSLGRAHLRLHSVPQSGRIQARRNFRRRDCPSRHVGDDGAGGDDQPAVELDLREIPGFRFGFKRLGQGGDSVANVLSVELLGTSKSH